MDRAFLMLVTFAISILRRITWLSLDIALSAMLLSKVVAKVFGVHLPWTVSLALFLCVWMIYTLDHLLDSRKMTGLPSMPRHAFHYRHASKLFILLILVAFSSLTLVFFLPTQTLLYGIVVAGLVGLYILMTWWLKVFVAKELLIALLYAVGIFIGPLSMGMDVSLPVLVSFTLIAMLALANLMLFSLNERDKDQADGFSSWATIFGEKHLERALRALFFFLTSVLGFAFILSQTALWPSFLFSLMAMLLILVLLFWRREFFLMKESYRLLGDFIFFFPAITLLF